MDLQGWFWGVLDEVSGNGFERTVGLVAGVERQQLLIEGELNKRLIKSLISFQA
jgi:hypothetical protein